MATSDRAYDTPSDVTASHTPPAEERPAPPTEIFEADSPTTGVPSQPGTTPALPPPDDPFAEFGGRDKVAEAQRIISAWETEEGATVYTVEALRRLGFREDVIESLFNWEEEEPDPLPDLEDDVPLTKADVIRLAQEIADRRVSPIEESYEQQVERQRFDTATRASIEELTRLGVQSEPDKQGVITMAQQYLGADDWDPGVIQAALRRGHADWEALKQAGREQYIQGKAQTAANLPTPMGHRSGGSDQFGEGRPEAPKSLEEAIQRQRDAFRRSGNFR